MQFSDIKAVVFDLDGTLLNTLDDLMNALNAALAANGQPERSREDVRRFVGNGLATLVERAIPSAATAASPTQTDAAPPMALRS